MVHFMLDMRVDGEGELPELEDWEKKGFLEPVPWVGKGSSLIHWTPPHQIKGFPIVSFQLHHYNLQQPTK